MVTVNVTKVTAGQARSGGVAAAGAATQPGAWYRHDIAVVPRARAMRVWKQGTRQPTRSGLQLPSLKLPGVGTTTAA
jgi:hypothetical protein